MTTRRLPESFAKQIERSLGAGRICPSVGDSAMQVTSHSTHHRGQLNTRLRELGEEPPQFDYIAWVWFGRPTAEWNEPVADDPR
ncbi:MAG TPA: hypothetical protein EYQ83_13305 [Acidobacteria bacterium]|nr:hypothetical protein [Acidobacteriota bacterium]